MPDICPGKGRERGRENITEKRKPGKGKHGKGRREREDEVREDERRKDEDTIN
jgi:hypothetical protein